MQGVPAVQPTPERLRHRGRSVTWVIGHGPRDRDTLVVTNRSHRPRHEHSSRLRLVRRRGRLLGRRDR